MLPPPAFLWGLFITSRTDRQTENALGQGKTKQRNLNNQPKIDSLLLNLISPNWIHMSWPWHINFNYGLLMSP